MLKICILDAKTLGEDIGLSVFDRFGSVEIYAESKPVEVIERIKDADVVITNKVVLKEETLKHAEKLKLICVAATGTNNIDLDCAAKMQIAVTNVAGYSTMSVVQHTFAMLFYLMENLPYYDKYVKTGEYAKSGIFTHHGTPFHELSGKTWGIIGLGAIGRAVANAAEAFGCKVVYYSTSGKNNNTQYERVELDSLLRESDIVSIHAPLNSSTKGLIDYKRLAAMKKSAIILNLGRGGIIKEEDLARVLDEGLIRGAALDVLESEPVNCDNPLLGIKNSERLFITPHIAWASIEARKRLVDEIALNIDAFLNGKERNRIC
ncbi:D-2-hydroxyacid dehydrogenase [Acetivibrio straminisolvens]|jgi:glycerate dehydrogenase|uniref:D-3-phosphoglycerate dehydrogenase n=1 Tax=Acetivibrio straminisolvens JCM 21531 TaxID=1294263 RepID=W4V7X4_9FIRM|nr:D-2-hydroxyacid dehydrogenase [Acetivibrio straminisolvens]GAE89291.1 D-3-phosphoglycerate dehydrogenase [Acetivibrio straminisolvens JCM 21531]